jgi:hypothetical protein
MDWMVWVDAILGLLEAMSCRFPSTAPIMMDCALAQRFFGGNPFVLSLGLCLQNKLWTVWCEGVIMSSLARR